MIAVSDGSFGFKIGMLAYILEGKNPSGHIVGVNIVPGYPEDQSSRANLQVSTESLLESRRSVKNIRYQKGK